MNAPRELHAAPPPPLAAERQADVLHGLRYRLLRNSGTLIFRNSRVRLVTAVACSVVVWAAMYALSHGGFDLLRRQQIPFAGGIVGVLFDLLFLALGVMLLFSTGIILYGSLFTAPESAYLLGTPVRADQVFAYKFQSALGFSSWAFVLLGSPLLIGYGVVFGVPWTFYVLLPMYFIGFLLIPGSLGALGTLLLTAYLTKYRRTALVVCGVILVMAVGYVGTNAVLSARGQRHGRDALQALLGQFAFAQSPFVPSHWMTRGVQASARGELADSLYALALLWANGLFLYVAAAFASRRLYRRAYDQLAGGGSRRKRFGTSPLDRLAGRMLWFVGGQTRLLILKDFITFRRDPLQWGQLFILLLLVLMYCVNSPQFAQRDMGATFRHAISVVNLAALATLLCAYMGRFIYPMLSLEGRKFWILGLLPLDRDRLVWGKFLFAAVGSLSLALPLILAGDLLLGLPVPALVLHVAATLALGVGLASLSVGLGALMPDFRETDPSKIAVGFGGTLNLIVGLLYLLVIVCTLALPYHVVACSRERPDGAEWHPSVILGVVVGLVIAVVATVWPLRAGARALRRMEF